LDKGYYRDYGLEVEIIMGGPNLASPDELYAGNAEFATMFLASALREIDKNRDIVNVAQLSQKSSLLLVALKSSGITTIKDINNKRVGLWAKDFYHPSIIFLNKNKITAQIVPMSWTVNILSEKVVDVINMMEYNEYDIFISSGFKPEDLTVFPLSQYGVNIPEDGIYCRKDYYLEHESLCHDFAEASMDGWFFALNHEEETLEMVLKNLKKAHLPANIPHQKWMLQKIRENMLYKPEQFGKLTEHDYNNAIKMMKQNNIITRSLPYEQFIGYAAQD
jgi:NitT/TauT family transport system substrate-binding protein